MKTFHPPVAPSSLPAKKRQSVPARPRRDTLRDQLLADELQRLRDEARTARDLKEQLARMRELARFD